MIIDHEDRTRNFMVKILKEKGFEVAAEKNASYIARTVDSFIPDMFIINLDFPKGEGLYFAGKFRKETDSMNKPIVGFIARLERSMLHELQQLSIKDIMLNNPLDELKLVKTVEKYYKIKVINDMSRDL